MSEFDHQLWSTFFGGNIKQAIHEPSPSRRLEVFGSAALETLLDRGVDLVEPGAVRKPYDPAKLDDHMATRIPA